MTSIIMNLVTCDFKWKNITNCLFGDYLFFSVTRFIYVDGLLYEVNQIWMSYYFDTFIV